MSNNALNEHILNTMLSSNIYNYDDIYFKNYLSNVFTFLAPLYQIPYRKQCIISNCQLHKLEITNKLFARILEQWSDFIRDKCTAISIRLIFQDL